MIGYAGIFYMTEYANLAIINCQFTNIAMFIVGIANI